MPGGGVSCLQRVSDVLEHGLEPRFVAKNPEGVRERPQRANENRGGRAGVEAARAIERGDSVRELAVPFARASRAGGRPGR